MAEPGWTTGIQTGISEHAADSARCAAADQFKFSALRCHRPVRSLRQLLPSLGLITAPDSTYERPTPCPGSQPARSTRRPRAASAPTLIQAAGGRAKLPVQRV